MGLDPLHQGGDTGRHIFLAERRGRGQDSTKQCCGSKIDHVHDWAANDGDLNGVCECVWKMES